MKLNFLYFTRPVFLRFSPLNRTIPTLLCFLLCRIWTKAFAVKGFAIQKAPAAAPSTCRRPASLDRRRSSKGLQGKRPTASWPAECCCGSRGRELIHRRDEPHLPNSVWPWSSQLFFCFWWNNMCISPLLTSPSFGIYQWDFIFSPSPTHFSTHDFFRHSILNSPCSPKTHRILIHFM